MRRKNAAQKSGAKNALHKVCCKKCGAQGATYKVRLIEVKL
jgi:hypothetical protein